MELEQIMQRIRTGDRDALRALIAHSGGDVYQRALAKTGDKALAKEITQKTFARLVTTLQEKDCAGGWQLWLDSLAESGIEAALRQRNDLSCMAEELDKQLETQPQGYGRPFRGAGAQPYGQPAAPRPQQTRPRESAPERPQKRREQRPDRAVERTEDGSEFEPEQGRGAGFGFGVFVLVLLCIALVWVAGGVLMGMGILPKIDLGYSWFNANVLKIF